MRSKSKSYYKLSHKREDMKDYIWFRINPWDIRMHKKRLAQRFKI